MNDEPTDEPTDDPKATEKDAIEQALDSSPTLDNVKAVPRETADAVAPDHDASQDAPSEPDGQG